MVGAHAPAVEQEWPAPINKESIDRLPDVTRMASVASELQSGGMAEIGARELPLGSLLFLNTPG